jgi:uncharacterized membrane protein
MAMTKKRGSQATQPPKRPENNPSADSRTLAAPANPSAEKILRESLEEAIGSVPNRGQVVERVVSLVRQEIFRGPLPHPRHLQAYEDICPGIADRIVVMAEKAHGRAEDRLDKELEFEFADRRLGMHLGFAALIALLCSGTFIIWLGNPAVGGTLLGAAVLGTAIGTFVHGRNRTPSAVPQSSKNESDAPKKPPFWKRIFGLS